jgi:NAD(P)-dependent dehydrogenase (short-subunit alcohol dehydrogenase family)
MEKRTYVVTGSASGIGAATSDLLKERGAAVIGVDLHEADVVADLSNSRGRLSAVEDSIKLSGGNIDAVIACAGSIRAKPATVSINFFGVIEFLNLIRPTLEKSPSPRVAIASSVASVFSVSDHLVEMMLRGNEDDSLAFAENLVAQGRESADLIYNSTKRAISRWIRRESVTPEWAGVGISLNAVGPGTVETPMVARLIDNPESLKALDTLIPMPLNYHLKPREVAYLLAWLTGVENSHTTGQTIYIDGGADVSIRGDNIWM